MSIQHGNAAYWRAAAGNARALAETFDDEQARHAMGDIANKLEAIAWRAYTQETGLKVVEGDSEKKAG